MRTFIIALRALPLGLSFRRDVRRWLLFGAPLRRTAAFHQRRAARLSATLAALGPTFVKLAQVFAARADLIPEPYLGALGALLDRVPAAPWPAIAAELRRSYGREPRQLFEQLDHEPLAAGSLGQVYRARYDGQDIVVKVLRPGVERVVARDLASARTLIRLVERRWPNPHVRGFRMAVEEFALRVDEEMDFRLEAEHAEEIRASLVNEPGIVVPRVLPAFTRQRVMVMEYVEGTRVDRLAPLIAAGRVDAHRIVQRVMEIYVRMMLMDGLFHADPHPGNLFVREDGALILLDFGMCVRVPVETRARLIRTVMAAIRRDPEAVAEGFDALGIVDPSADPAEIRRLVQLLLDLAFSGVAPQEAARVLAEEVMRTLYDWPIVLTGEMTYFARAAALIEGLGVRYVPDFNAIAFASPIVLRMRHHILRSLQMDGTPPTPGDWAAALGAIAGQAARVVSSAGRELMTVVGGGLAELVARSTVSTSGGTTAAPGAPAELRDLGNAALGFIGRLLAPAPSVAPPRARALPAAQAAQSDEAVAAD